jgi:putative inorganic carbon (HCO3(-)) transporter
VTASALQLLVLLVASGAAALALLARDRRLRLAAATLALAASPALVAGDVWHSSRLVDLRQDPLKLSVAIAAATLTVGVAAAAFSRLPWAFPVTLFAVLPLRVPIQVAGETAHLLIPLYLVIAAGLASVGYAELAGERRSGAGRAWRSNAAFAGEPPPAVWLRRLIAAMLVLYALQTAYSVDVSNAIENACFFLIPFAVMLMLIGEVRWTRGILGGVLVAVAAMALVFAAVAFGEYAARDLLLSRGNLLQSNQLHLYFRVNSLFYDPNLFGRDLAFVLVALGAFLAWSRDARAALPAALAAGILLAALALSYSITSFLALLVGLLVVAGLRWGLRWALAGGAAIVLCAGLFLLASGTERSQIGSSDDLNTFSSGRVNLVSGGIRLARDRPAAGWGSGSFGAAFSRHVQRARTTVSHSEPITVAAEQGVIGLVPYVALVALALVVLLGGASASVATAAIAACFVALVVHSLGYAGFATDPATWAVLGLGLALRRREAWTGTAAVADAAGGPGVPRSPHDPRPAPVR